jgi:HSP20 family protein
MNGFQWQRRWDPLRDLQREMGKLLESLDPLQPWRVAHPYPPINLYDGGDRYILTAQLPGVLAEDVELSITGETLAIRGERKRQAGVADESYRRQERFFGRWTRSVTLPDRVDGARVEASFAQGILTVTIPKAESAQARHIIVSNDG